ncbi:MAG: hypothetical protein IPM91_08215 [Bacteroidetes bacterium]|nr:hypothetical protein [Bacteroidota bacterium]
MADLEDRNSKLKQRLAEFKADSKDGWVSFKAEFNHDMEELGNAMKDLTTDNKK